MLHSPGLHQDSSAFSFTICLPSGFIAAFVESKPEPNE
ncbi:hypothetical protein NC653_008881 [Populus alba x Populus x berolinensis]|uniref:Uncharacterized protein n=1 Tax=Populus alba x Populus x berolinensis TaxID=444605 RepID=A0AAD6R7V6_9ROSI|nr:hypothetical protein NC653_008881 [Populus alba x Populus x berolinensis]